MSESGQTQKQNAPNLAPEDLARYGRQNRMKPPQGLLRRSLVALHNCLESGVARASVHGDPPVYDNAIFPWVCEVETAWRKARAELDQVMQFRDRMPSFHEILKEAGTITTDDQWKTYFLTGIGMDCAGNAARCPDTMRILRKIPGLTTAFFSILSPRKHIPPHRGAYNGVLRLHLALLVPEPRERCRIRIANQIHHWTEGQCLIFDDTFNHEVWNDTDGYRVVLFVDFARPLKPPIHHVNTAFLNMAAFAPALREAGNKQKMWEKQLTPDHP